MKCLFIKNEEVNIIGNNIKRKYDVERWKFNISELRFEEFTGIKMNSIWFSWK